MKIALFFLALATAASAQSGGPWAITSSTLDAGGGTSAGGSWKLTGTIGQPDATAQPSIATAWAFSGGFWPGAITTPGGPMLAIYPLDATRFTVAWTRAAVGYKLQHSSDLKTWTDYPGLTITDASSVVWPKSSGPRYFFRLKKL